MNQHTISWLKNTFSQIEQRIVSEFLFERDINYLFDIVHPNQVGYASFVLAGISYGIGKNNKGLVDNKLRELLIAEFLPAIEGTQPSSLELLRDATQALNSLESFLGGDRGKMLSLLLNTEDANPFTHQSLHTLAERAVDILIKENYALSEWQLLYAVLGGLPPYPDLAERFKGVIKQTDFVNFRENAIWVIHIASLHTINFKDQDACSHLKNQLISTAKYLAKQDLANIEDTCSILVESALNISIGLQSSGKVIDEFVNLLTQLYESWKAMQPALKHIVHRLYDELPILQAQKFLTLLMRLRAE